MEDASPDTPEDLAAALQALAAQIESVEQYRVVKVQRTWLGVIAYSLIRGLFFGFGSVLGATVLVSLLVYILSGIDFIPIIGDWARQIIAILQDGQG